MLKSEIERLLLLSKEDAEKVALIIEDVRKSTVYEIGLAGSLAQRAISREIAESLRGQPLHDVDLLLLNTTESSPLNSSARALFDVFEETRTDEWYVGMRHRRTGMWVDLFGAPESQNILRIEFEGESIKATSIESQVLYLAQDILRRAGTDYPVRRKWVEKLERLSSLESTDWKTLENEFEDNRECLLSFMPEGSRAQDAREYVALAITQPITSRFADFLFLIRWFLFLRK